jgi:hypothetical protein
MSIMSSVWPNMPPRIERSDCTPSDPGVREQLIGLDWEHAHGAVHLVKIERIVHARDDDGFGVTRRLGRGLLGQRGG